MLKLTGKLASALPSEDTTLANFYTIYIVHIHIFNNQCWFSIFSNL